jgi:transcription initiation factor IIE alpha subunit
MKVTNVENVYFHLRLKGLFCEKEDICNDLGMRKISVDRALRILKKDKKVVMHRKKYWGVI